VPIRAVLDAPALTPPRVRDVLLALAEDTLFQPYWSDGIVAEVERRLPSHMSRPARDFLFAELETAFPEARVTWPATVLREVPYISDPRDAHLTAVALFAQADVVVTTDAGLARSLERSGVEPQTPDAFVAYVLDAEPQRCRRVLLRMARRRWLGPGEETPDAALQTRLAAWARRDLGDNSADLLAADPVRP
jgi:predicted nucleic acid-binding protein